MRRRIVGIQRDCLFEAGHRLIVTAEFGEHPTKITMGLCPVGREVESPAQRRLGFGKPLETHQGVGMMDICPEKLRYQREGALGACETRCEFLLLIEHRRKIVMRHAIIGVERYRAAVARHRFRQPAGLAQNVAVVQMYIGQFRQLRQRALDQPQRRPDFSALVGYHPEKVERIGVIRVFLQRFAVEGLRPPQLSGLMMGKSGAHGPQPPRPLPRLSLLFFGCDPRL